MNRFFLCHFGPALPFQPNNSMKNQVWKNEKKSLEILFYTCITKIISLMYGSWDTEGDTQKFLSFSQRPAKSKFWENIEKCPEIIVLPVRQISWWYDLQFLWYEGSRGLKLAIFNVIFALLPLHWDRKSKLWKKKTRYIIRLHKCTKIHNQMPYAICNDGCNFYFSFWAIFCP